MEIKELLEIVNLKLNEGLSTSKIEKELGYGKDTLRQKLNRNGYNYSKTLKQFVTQDNTVSVTEKNKNITQDNTGSYKKERKDYNTVNKTTGGLKKMTLDEFKELSTIEQVNLINRYTDGKLTLREIEKRYFTFTNVGKYIDRSEAFWDGKTNKYILIEQKSNIFSEEEIMFIKNLYKQNKVKEEINDMEQGEIINRSIRINGAVMEQFAECCKKYNIKQTNALSVALMNFVKKMEE